MKFGKVVKRMKAFSPAEKRMVKVLCTILELTELTLVNGNKIVGMVLV